MAGAADSTFAVAMKIMAALGIGTDGQAADEMLAAIDKILDDWQDALRDDLANGAED